MSNYRKTILALLLMVSVCEANQKTNIGRPLPQIPSSDTIYILSIDGAAVRGIAQNEILQGIESEVNKQLKAAVPNFKSMVIQDMFDVFAGTSAGSINVGTLMLTNGHGKPAMTFEKMKELVPATLEAAFSSTTFRKIRTVGGIIGSKLSAKPLEQMLKETGGQARISDTYKPTLITSFDIRARESIEFSTFDACRGAKDKDVYMWEALRASSAAPVFYKPYEINIGGKSRALVDGGLYAQSPALLAWVEAQKIYPGKKYVVVSISGGSMPEDRDYKAKGNLAGGVLQALSPTIETFTEGQQVLTAKVLSEMPNTTFHRLSFELRNNKFDDFSDKNVKALKDGARATIDSQAFKNVVAGIVKLQIERIKLNNAPKFVCPIHH